MIIQNPLVTKEQRASTNPSSNANLTNAGRASRNMRATAPRPSPGIAMHNDFGDAGVMTPLELYQFSEESAQARATQPVRNVAPKIEPSGSAKSSAGRTQKYKELYRKKRDERRGQIKEEEGSSPDRMAALSDQQVKVMDLEYRETAVKGGKGKQKRG